MYSNKYVLDLLKDAIVDETIDNKFYTEMANKFPENKMEFLSIAQDEQKHKNMFEDIYQKLTDTSFEPTNINYKTVSENLNENLSNAVSGELSEIEMYRPILFALENQQFQNYLFEIITDEQKHATKLNHIYIKNK